MAYSYILVGRRAFVLGSGLAAIGGRAQVLSSSQLFEITVREGKKIKGPSLIKLKKGDEIGLLLNCDSAEELHIHGYGIMVKVDPLQTVTVHFIASRTGRFEFEFHRLGLRLGVIEVHPS